MSAQKQSFDFFPVLAGAQFTIPHTALDIGSRIEVRMRAMTTHLTAKRLLVRSVLLLYMIAHAALL